MKNNNKKRIDFLIKQLNFYYCQENDEKVQNFYKNEDKNVEIFIENVSFFHTDAPIELISSQHLEKLQSDLEIIYNLSLNFEEVFNIHSFYLF